MSKREFASLACKILGIYMIIQGINVFANVITISMVTPNQIGPQGLINIVAPFIFLIIFGVLLWLLSDKLSISMTKGEIRSNEGVGVTASDIQRISFSFIGLLLIGNSLPKLVSALINFYSVSQLNSPTRIIIAAREAITQLIVGLGIFIGSQGLVNLLTIVRTAGLKREEAEEE